MKQLTQNLKSGNMDIIEVPYPAMGEGMVLVRNHFSLISAGTEGGKVKTARKSLIGKAKEKPQQVEQVLDSLKTEGLVQTYNKVMNKLDATSPLGYSCAGEVIEVGSKISNIKVGDFVACGGDTAVHAEVVAVPRNLCVKIPENVPLKYAAFTTVASIAVQGIRQADLRFGENCAIIGLGLIGQLTAQILNAAGIKVAGIDVDSKMVEVAGKMGAHLALNRADTGLTNKILEFSNGNGVDAVIITAGTHSLDPIELSGVLCRKKAKVVVVGAVPTGFSRENYYKKELSLRMSSSYGPGRYDANYEQKGQDYPIAYTRWTENRNMQSFLDMLNNSKIDIGPLITHTYKFENAKDAYETIIKGEASVVGVLLEYNTGLTVKKSISYNSKKFESNKNVNVGFIGAGSFAQKFLLPNLKNTTNLVAVLSGSGNNSANIAMKYQFRNAVSTESEIYENSDINTIFIATRHNLHAQSVLNALKNGKHVFVEKPLCLYEEELYQIKNEYEQKNLQLLVGFNRRFAPAIQRIKNEIKEGKVAINYRINAGNIPSDSWIQDAEIGGGRILGEVCHFVDLCVFLANSKVKLVSAFAIDDANSHNDILNINLQFENNSIATVSYFANGSKKLKKEHLEVFSHGNSFIVDDFKKSIHYGKRKKSFSSNSQNKGHKNEVKLFVESIQNNKESIIPFDEIFNSTLTTFKIVESLKTRKTIQIPG